MWRQPENQDTAIFLKCLFSASLLNSTGNVQVNYKNNDLCLANRSDVVDDFYCTARPLWQYLNHNHQKVAVTTQHQGKWYRTHYQLIVNQLQHTADLYLIKRDNLPPGSKTRIGCFKILCCNYIIIVVGSAFAESIEYTLVGSLTLTRGDMPLLGPCRDHSDRAQRLPRCCQRVWLIRMRGWLGRIYQTITGFAGLTNRLSQLSISASFG